MRFPKIHSAKEHAELSILCVYALYFLYMHTEFKKCFLNFCFSHPTGPWIVLMTGLSAFSKVILDCAKTA